MPTSSDSNYAQHTDSQTLVLKEQGIEEGFIEKLRSLKYTYRPDIIDRASLEKNFREKFEALNRVSLTPSEFQRLLDELVTPDVFTAARVIRERNDFIRDDGTPLTYTLVNIKDWCKNDFEVVHQLRINTDYSHHRYAAWRHDQATASRDFSPEQSEWLDRMAEHVATSLAIEPSDFEDRWFGQRGSLGRAHALFGDKLKRLIAEMNESLAA